MMFYDARLLLMAKFVVLICADGGSSGLRVRGICRRLFFV